MEPIFFFFIFKHRFRRRALNNFINIKKIRNFKIFDLSGIFKYYILGLPLYLLSKIFTKFFKNFVFISCDGKPQIKEQGINIWFGGTSYKIPNGYKNFKNNCFVFENFSKLEENLLDLYPYNPIESKLLKDYKIVFVGSFNISDFREIDEIWEKEKKEIFNNLRIIDDYNFWKKYDLHNHARIQTYYLQLKERLRFNLIIELKKIFGNKILVVGSKWKKYINDSLDDEFDLAKISRFYNGNICIDFGSKWGSNIFYPRSVEIIEHGGLLVQLEQSNTSKKFYELNVIEKFDNFDQLSKKLNNLINNENIFHQKIYKQNNFFNDPDLNYDTFKKIYEISQKKS